MGRLARVFDAPMPSTNGHSTAIRIQMPGGSERLLGKGEPAVTVIAKTKRALRALASMDLLAACEAYVEGLIDIEGEFKRVIALGNAMTDRHPLIYLMRFVRPLLRGQIAADRKNVPYHYKLEPEFWQLWLDKRHRCYSHGFFERDDESLEDAVSRKLDYALEAVNARPGDRILDIGGGWGAFNEHAGKRGMRVTSLTISEPSLRFITNLIKREQLDCQVLLEHFYEHRPAQKYDAIVNMGVTEHLPDYARTLRHYDALLKPGGKVYLDASANRERGGITTFQERYVYRGNGMLMCLHDYMKKVARSPFEPELVINDRHSYALTAGHWAANLDQNRATIEQRWGKAAHRRFQLYLWATADAFEQGRIQAYHVVLRRCTALV